MESSSSQLNSSLVDCGSPPAIIRKGRGRSRTKSIHLAMHSSSHLACNALNIVLQRLMIPQLDWHMESYESRLPLLRTSIIEFAKREVEPILNDFDTFHEEFPKNLFDKVGYFPLHFIPTLSMLFDTANVEDILFARANLQKLTPMERQEVMADNDHSDSNDVMPTTNQDLYHESTTREFLATVYRLYFEPLCNAMQHQAITIVETLREAYLKLYHQVMEWFHGQQKRYAEVTSLVVHQLVSLGHCMSWLELLEMSLFSLALTPLQLELDAKSSLEAACNLATNRFCTKHEIYLLMSETVVEDCFGLVNVIDDWWDMDKIYIKWVELLDVLHKRIDYVKQKYNHSGPSASHWLRTRSIPNPLEDGPLPTILLHNLLYSIMRWKHSTESQLKSFNSSNDLHELVWAILPMDVLLEGRCKELLKEILHVWNLTVRHGLFTELTMSNHLESFPRLKGIYQTMVITLRIDICQHIKRLLFPNIFSHEVIQERLPQLQSLLEESYYHGYQSMAIYHSLYLHSPMTLSTYFDKSISVRKSFEKTWYTVLMDELAYLEYLAHSVLTTRAHYYDRVMWPSACALGKSPDSHSKMLMFASGQALANAITDTCKPFNKFQTSDTMIVDLIKETIALKRTFLNSLVDMSVQSESRQTTEHIIYKSLLHDNAISYLFVDDDRCLKDEELWISFVSKVHDKRCMNLSKSLEGFHNIVNANASRDNRCFATQLLNDVFQKLTARLNSAVEDRNVPCIRYQLLAADLYCSFLCDLHRFVTDYKTLYSKLHGEFEAILAELQDVTLSLQIKLLSAHLMSFRFRSYLPLGELASLPNLTSFVDRFKHQVAQLSFVSDAEFPWKALNEVCQHCSSQFVSLSNQPISANIQCIQECIEWIDILLCTILFKIESMHLLVSDRFVDIEDFEVKGFGELFEKLDWIIERGINYYESFKKNFDSCPVSKKEELVEWIKKECKFPIDVIYEQSSREKARKDLQMAVEEYKNELYKLRIKASGGSDLKRCNIDYSLFSLFDVGLGDR